MVWAVGFPFDADEQGRPITVCSIVDEHTRERVGGLVERSITAQAAYPPTVRTTQTSAAPQRCAGRTNGPEFISDAMANWAATRTRLSSLPPGSPWCNGYVESPTSRLRDECLTINRFPPPVHAQVVIGDWKTEYNHDRRHSPLGYPPPADYARQCTHRIETDDLQITGPKDGAAQSHSSGVHAFCGGAALRYGQGSVIPRHA